jgi:hypothetical protein
MASGAIICFLRVWERFEVMLGCVMAQESSCLGFEYLELPLEDPALSLEALAALPLKGYQIIGYQVALCF